MPRISLPAVMRWEQVPELPLFANNTAAFIHEMDAESPEGGWGIAGYANTNSDIAALARAALEGR